MKILSNREYNKLIDKIKCYQTEFDDAMNSKYRFIEKAQKIETENFKLKNIIKSYKGVDNKQIRTMIEKLYKRINFALEDLNTLADEIDKLFIIYYNLKGVIEDGTSSNE